MTSPMRPMAWLSEDIIESAPRSCRMSSAAIVSLRMRLSAKARSSAIDGSRWWQTISMSRCSSRVLTVNGRVGFVEEGSTFGSPATLMMSGAWPPPAPSVWKAWMVRPLKARDGVLDEAGFVQRVGVDHHLDVVVVGDGEAIVDRRRRRAPVLVQLQRAGAGLRSSRRGRRGARRCPCRKSRDSSGRHRPRAASSRDARARACRSSPRCPRRGRCRRRASR